MKKFLLLSSMLTFVLSPKPDALKAQEMPINVEEGQAQDSEWEKLTSWLRRRPNPFRSSSSDIDYRGRRPIFSPPPFTKEGQGDGAEQGTPEGDKSFFAKQQRRLKLIQEAFDRDDFDRVISLANPFIFELSQVKKISVDFEEVHQEFLKTAKMMRDVSREKNEINEIQKVMDRLSSMKDAFQRKDFGKVRELGDLIDKFVSNWSFSDLDRERKARLYLKESSKLSDRAKLRQEFSQLTIEISFWIVSSDAKVPSTATINNRAVKEGEYVQIGEVLNENLLVKKITKNHILFEYKGEPIKYDKHMLEDYE